MKGLEEKEYRLVGSVCKVVPTSDGGREVSGYATTETPDLTGEIIDWEPTLKALQEWSNEQFRASGGKSYGNMRHMHQLEAVGKVSAPIQAVKALDENGNEVNAIWIDTYVPSSHPDIIKDLDEGILTGFSVGGKYATVPTYDATKKARKYTPLPIEISYVDKSCVNRADIKSIIEKAAGSPQKGEPMAKIPQRDDLQKDASIVVSTTANNEFDGSFDSITNAVYNACSAQYKGTDEYWHGWVCRVFPERAIVCFYDQNDGKDHYYFVPYTIDDKGTVTLGEKTEVQRITEYLPLEVQKAIHEKMQKAAEDSERDKLRAAAEARAKTHGIGVKEGGHLTPPKDSPADETDYGDPVNYSYPIDGDHIQAAVSYFNHEKQQEAGGYTAEEWAKIGERIAEAANKHEGGEKKYSYKDGKIEIETKEVKKSMTSENVRKAAEAAGLTGDVLEKFLKAAEADETDPPDEAGEEQGDETIDEAAKAAGIAPELLKTFKVELAKAGRTISGSTGKHLEAMHKAARNAADKIGVIKAALLSGKPMDDNALEVDDANIGTPPATAPNTPMLAPEVVSKAVGDELNKAGVSDLSKAASLLPELQKSIGGTLEAIKKLVGLPDKLAALEKTVQEIHDAPAQSGPVGRAQRINSALLDNAATAADKTAILQDFVKSIGSADLRDKMGQELALQMAKANK